MNNSEAQKVLLQAMQDIVDATVSKISTTNSVIGAVVEMPKGYDIKVEINGQLHECLLPENLHSWIQKDDIVIIQDLYNDGRKMVVTGKTGAIQRSPSLVFSNEESGKLVSGVDGAFENGKRLDANLTVEGE